MVRPTTEPTGRPPAFLQRAAFDRPVRLLTPHHTTPGGDDWQLEDARPSKSDSVNALDKSNARLRMLDAKRRRTAANQRRLRHPVSIGTSMASSPGHSRCPTGSRKGSPLSTNRRRIHRKKPASKAARSWLLAVEANLPGPLSADREAVNGSTGPLGERQVKSSSENPPE